MLKNIKGICIDISGVIYTGKKLCSQNILYSYEKLLKSGNKVLFVTNTNRITKKELQETLENFGLKIELDRIFSSPETAKSILQKHKLSKPFLLVTENLKEEFIEFPQNSKDESFYDSLVLGNLSTKTTYEEINFGFRILRNLQKEKKVPVLISMGNNRYFEDLDHKLSMSTGCFIESYKHSLQNWKPKLEVIIAGKPDISIFFGASEKLGLKTEECVMIGDDLDGDIIGKKFQLIFRWYKCWNVFNLG